MKVIKTVIYALPLAITLLIPSSAKADTAGKPNVLIDYFWRPANIPFSCAEQLRSYVMEGITNTNRVELIDVDAQDALQIEASRRESGVDAGDDADRMKVMSQQGANFLIQGRIASLNIEEKTTDEGAKYYTGKLSYTLKVINPNDGKLVLTKTLKHGGELLNMETSSTPDEAVTKVCRNAVKGIVPFIQEAFPLYGTLLECNEVKGDKVNSVYLSLGSQHGVAEKDRFEVCIVREIAGRKSTPVIGECEISSIEGDDISNAKIKKGHKEIKSAVDAGQTIVFKSVPKKEGLLGGFKI
ncbi:hypothetical protein [uncultured Muribaculum sp.]|uniref:hypothetical protein n=1 Tax=uncultured Muribaculum sp. TaxID=1918613 RepID=UPI00266EA1D4|nr:hypothetical protein [uncultured Muribaculum sp.]